ncbi:hypothetical protein ABMA27_006174 [Loxostege sticticalis]|uniref:Major facilitator superfamily (MFS) profile domain-containing protein n=1 Tax=Loxostege sticticalis TaxID=481309 RepID=A0ABR3HHU4_LOXSC
MEDNEEELLGINADNELEDRRPNGFQLRYTIEFPLFLIMFGVALAAVPTSNLLMYRTCVHSLNYTVDDCKSFLEPDKINHTQELEKEVQEYLTIVNTVRTVLEAFVPGVLSLFLGVWSDKHGRKPLLVMTFFGLTLSAMLAVVYSLMESLGPWWIIVSNLSFSFTGGFNVLTIGAMCFISDVTNKDNRSFRLTLTQLTYALGQTTGGMVSPFILKVVGYDYFLLGVATIHTLGLTYTMVFIEESLTNIEQGNMLSAIKLSHLKEMASACFKRRPNYRRAILLITVASSTLALFTLYGTNGLLYLYTRTQLQWTMEDFTTFSSISTAVWFAGSFIGVAFIQKWTRMSDLTFIALSCLSCVFEYIIKACARTTWVMYLGSAVSLFGTVYAVLIRSFLSKALPTQDIAKAFGLLSATESFFCPLLSPLVYNALYELTISSFPASILVLTSAVYFLCFILILIVVYLVRRTSTNTYQVIEEED